jgi:hypothetical protein
MEVYSLVKVVGLQRREGTSPKQHNVPKLHGAFLLLAVYRELYRTI